MHSFRGKETVGQQSTREIEYTGDTDAAGKHTPHTGGVLTIMIFQLAFLLLPTRRFR
jgi:hypothetical protein